MEQTCQGDTRTQLCRPGEPAITTKMVEKVIQQQEHYLLLCKKCSFNRERERERKRECVKIAALKPGKSSGLDKIHTRLLKELSFEVSEPLKVIFETSLRHSKLPSIWKLASITAIFKKRNKKYPENYRPVSLTSVPCKLLKSIIRDNIVKHMNANDLFT